MRFTHICCLLIMACCWSTARAAEDIRQVYQLAVANDPTLQAAFASMKANLQAFPEALAQMAPNLSGNYQSSGVEDSLNFLQSYNTKTYGLTLNQPLFHPEHWAQLEQARHVEKGAVAAYLGVTQQLILRVANQYFAILAALDDLQFAQSSRKAFARQLEQNQQRFEVGLIAITDVQDAKARHDDAVATEIAAQNAVFDQYEKLREITGVPIKEVAVFPINNRLSLLPPNPNNQEEWVRTAHRFNLDVITAKENAQQQKAAIGIQVAGHYPKFDLQGSVQRSKPAPPFPFDQLGISRTLTINISMPIFSGGGVLFRTQEFAARYEQAQKELETKQRFADSSTRQAFRGVLTAISSVNALAQAVISNQTALEATRASYEVGTRTMVDVLNAESSLFAAQRDHSKARYDYILQILNLKQAAGTLESEDLFDVSDLLSGKTTTVVEQKDNLSN